MSVRAEDRASRLVITGLHGTGMGNVEGYKWIHGELIKPIQKSIGSMGPRRPPAKKEKVQDVRCER